MNYTVKAYVMSVRMVVLSNYGAIQPLKMVSLTGPCVVIGLS